jgi:hypothetical protein
VIEPGSVTDAHELAYPENEAAASLPLWRRLPREVRGTLP